MIKKYFKFKLFTNYLYLVPQIVLTFIFLVMSMSSNYNRYGRVFGVVTQSANDVYMFITQFASDGNIPVGKLSVACAGFFLIYCRKEKLQHIAFLVLYNIYSLTYVFINYNGYYIPFMVLIIYTAYIKFLTEDVGIDCRNHLILRTVFAGFAEIPWAFLMFCGVNQYNPSVELLFWHSVCDMIVGIYDVLIFKKLFSQYREEPVCDSVPEPINIAEQSGGSDTY